MNFQFKLPSQVKKVFAQVDAMSVRERGMVALTVMALLWALWDNALMAPLRALETARQEQMTSLSQQVADLNGSIQTLAATRTADPEAETRRRLAELRVANIELDARLADLMRDLVQPGDMAALLEAVLVETGQLELQAMNTLEPQPILNAGMETGYYRHGLSVRVRGSYLDALTYLQALEQLRWNFFWDSVEIRVEQHPSSEITIVVYTLGSRPGALGV